MQSQGAASSGRQRSGESTRPPGAIDPQAVSPERLELAKETYARVVDASRQLEDRVNRLFTGVAFITTGALAFGFQTELFTIRYLIGEGGLPLPGYAFLGYFVFVILGVLLLLTALAPASARYSGPPYGFPGYGRVSFLDIADASPSQWQQSWLAHHDREFPVTLLSSYLSESHRVAVRAEYRHGRINEARGAFTLAFTSLFLAIALSVNALVRLRVPSIDSGRGISLSALGDVPWDHWAIAIVILSSSLFAGLVSYERYRGNQNLDALESTKYWTSWRRYRRIWLLILATPIFQVGVLADALPDGVRILLCIVGVVTGEAALWQKSHTGWQYILVGFGIAFAIGSSLAIVFDAAQLQLLTALLMIVALELPRMLYSTVKWNSIKRDSRRRVGPVRRPRPNPWLDRRVLNIAHQGGAKEGPSNTICAMKRALEAGASAIDVDVHATSDEVIVAIHDTTLDRTTDGSGRVRLISGEEIVRHDAAYWWVPGKVDDHEAAADRYELRGRSGDDPDLCIPTLENVLDLVRDRYVTIEVKDRVAVEATAAAILAAGAVDRVLVGSFYDGVVRALRRRHPHLHLMPGRVWTVGFVVRSWIGRPPRQSRFAALAVPETYAVGFGRFKVTIRVVNRRTIDHAHQAGMAVLVWTVDDEADMRRLLDWEVDGIYTDRPSLLAGLLPRP